MSCVTVVTYAHGSVVTGKDRTVIVDLPDTTVRTRRTSRWIVSALFIVLAVLVGGVGVASLHSAPPIVRAQFASSVWVSRTPSFLQVLIRVHNTSSTPRRTTCHVRLASSYGNEYGSIHLGTVDAHARVNEWVKVYDPIGLLDLRGATKSTDVPAGSAITCQ